MSNKRITDLTELTTPTTDDVFPVVDIATNTTTKVQLGNLPVPTSVTTALATKQDTLVSGTNIKTVNSTSLLGSGNVAVQETLVSGTNIKTINSTSLLGSGNITIAANPSGVAGAIQFSDGSAFASDAANFFWDNTNKRLGVGTNSPSATFHSVGAGRFQSLILGAASAAAISNTSQDVAINITNQGVGIGSFTTFSPTARLQVRGSGSTSATTSLLVQNSSGTTALQITDNNILCLGGTTSSFPAIQRDLSEVRFRLADNSGFCNIRTKQHRFENSSVLADISDGVMIMANNSITDFNRLQFGGTTSSFPAIKKASNNIEIRNADDTFGAGFSVGSALNASAILQASSTTKGFLPPVMTTTQKNAIATPASGLVVYDSTTNKLCCYNGSTWNDLF